MLKNMDYDKTAIFFTQCNEI